MNGLTTTRSGLSNKLSAFADMAEGTSLFLIRLIDQTVDALNADAKAASGLMAAAAVLSKELKGKKAETGKYLDPEDAIILKIKSSYEAIETLLPKMLVMKKSIDDDNRLNENHCELLHSAYDETIDALAAMVEAVKDLRATIISHDLAAEPRECETFEEVPSLLTALRATA